MKEIHTYRKIKFTAYFLLTLFGSSYTTAQIENVKVDTTIYKSDGVKEVNYSQKVDDKIVFEKTYINDVLVKHVTMKEGLYHRKFWYENGNYLGDSFYKYEFNTEEEKDFLIAVNTSITYNENGDTLRFYDFGNVSMELIIETDLYDGQHWQKNINMSYYDDGSLRSREERERSKEEMDGDPYLTGWQIECGKDTKRYNKSLYVFQIGGGQKKLQEVGPHFMEDGPTIMVSYESYNDNGELIQIWNITKKIAEGKYFSKPGILTHHWKSSLKYVAEHGIENDFENEIWYNEDGSIREQKGKMD